MVSLSAITSRFCSLRAAVASSLSNSTNVIAMALAIDADFAIWHANLPNEMIPSIVQIERMSTDIHSDHFAVYGDMLAAMLLNHYRTVRILVHELIVSQFKHICPIDPLHWDRLMYQLHSSKIIMKELIGEICASAPFHLGKYPYLPGFLTASPGLSRPCPESTRAGGGNAIVWPLFAAGECDSCDNDTRKWILARLKTIAKDMGIGQAAVLAQVLLEKKEVTDLVMENAKGGVSLEAHP